MFEGDAQALELEFQDDPVPAWAAGEDGGDVAKQQGASRRYWKLKEDVDHIQTFEGGEELEAKATRDLCFAYWPGQDPAVALSGA